MDTNNIQSSILRIKINYLRYVKFRKLTNSGFHKPPNGHELLNKGGNGICDLVKALDKVFAYKSRGFYRSTNLDLYSFQVF